MEKKHLKKLHFDVVQNCQIGFLVRDEKGMNLRNPCVDPNKELNFRVKNPDEQRTRF